MNRRALVATVKGLCVRLGIDRLVAPVLGGAGMVLVFHRVRPRDPGLRFSINHQNTVPPEAFVALLDLLRHERIDVVGLDEAGERLAARAPGRFACLTFDDGYRDNHEVMFPIVRERGVPVTIYVAPGLIDGTAPLWWYALDQVIARESRLRLPLPGETDLPAAAADDKERAFARAVGFFLDADAEASARAAAALADRYGVDFAALAGAHMMTWDMVRDLAGSPLVEIGAHTMTHPNLRRLGADAARHELSESRARLARETGRPVRHLAYPFGTALAVGARETRLAAELGFATGVSASPGNLGTGAARDPMLWPRHGIGPDDGPDAVRLKLAGISRAWRGA